MAWQSLAASIRHFGSPLPPGEAEPGDLLLIVADEWMTSCEVLGQLRNDLGRPPVHDS